MRGWLLAPSGPRLAAWALLLGVFFLNYVGTAIKDRVHSRPVSELATERRSLSRRSSRRFSTGVRARRGEQRIADYGYSISYSSSFR